ncbi:unnamed protein product [Lymnaea stagnalis]|uniref:Carboxylic ester hydrolase n=1 Tax=Lymnaea stagnalis TaxID=6523 RepID=A0AAV2IP52_LYMST
MTDTRAHVLAALVWFGALCFATAAPSGSHDVIVALDKGQQLRGVRVTFSSGEAVSKFYGIPYAQPPTGERRFEPPAAAHEWSGIRDARTPGTICPQNPSQQNVQYTRSEDCLNLSVFSPDVNSSHPVLVWIHGGGFRVGSQFSDGDGSTLARYGIVVASINYRLGPFGFLSTGDDVMPGNYGLLDQILALKWVQKNIHFFGGDPTQVTIAGASAGAISTSLHILSPLSKGLFKRAVMESGSCFVASGLERPGSTVQVKNFTAAVAAKVGCSNTHSSALLHCLRGVDADRLLNASVETEHAFDILFIAVPRVETTFGFLPDYPKNILASGNYNHVSTLRGFNSGEWAYVVQDSNNDGVTREQFTRYFRRYFHKNSFVNNDAIERLVEEAYLADETDPKTIRRNLVAALADLTYGGAELLELEKTVERPGGATHHYFYEFKYRANNTATPLWSGVAHAGERPFVFFDQADASRSVADKTVGEHVQTMWTNFVKVGNPTPTAVGNNTVHWSRFTSSNQAMLLIGAKPVLEKIPRPFVISLYEQALQLMHAAKVVDPDVVIG